MEERAPLRDSRLWQWQDSTYEEWGPDAWTQKGVPFYLTSNPLIASQYAQLIAEWSGGRSVTVVNIGCGSGRFDYLCVRSLQRLIGDRFRYIATDKMQKNIERLRAHPYFHGLPIEFAQYDPLEDRTIPRYDGGPLAATANYLFDTIVQDRFRVKAGQLQQGYLRLREAATIDEMGFQWEYEACQNPFEGKVAEVLEEYRRFIDGSSFLFPIGAFAVIERLLAQSSELLLISGDQGVSSREQVSEWEPDVHRHGSFSMPVDLHALDLYISHTGGRTFLTDNPDPKFVVQASVWPATTTKGFEHAWQKLSDNEPAAFYRKQEALQESDGVEAWSLAKEGLGDPAILFECHEKVASSIDEIDAAEALETLCRARDHFFPVCPEESAVFVNIGVLFFQLGKKEEAKRTFEMACKWNPADEVAARNLRAVGGSVSLGS